MIAETVVLVVAVQECTQLYMCADLSLKQPLKSFC